MVQLANYKSSRFMRLPCTPGRNAGGEDKTNEHLQTQRYRNCRPYSNLALRMSAFFMKEMNKAFPEITGAKVNKGVGYGLEVPCVYYLYGSNVYVDKMKVLVESLLADEHYNLCNSDFAQ